MMLSFPAMVNVPTAAARIRSFSVGLAVIPGSANLNAIRENVPIAGKAGCQKKLKKLLLGCGFSLARSIWANPWVAAVRVALSIV